MKRILIVFSIFIMASSCNPVPDKVQIVMDNILSRKSVRSYTSEQVPEEMIQTLLKAAMAAPSAKNRQPWEFIVLNDRTILDTLAGQLRYAKMLAEAPLAIVVCAATHYEKADGTLAENHCWEHDASAATENLLLAAEAMGLGAVWTAANDDERAGYVRAALGIPSSLCPLCVVAIGWPKGEFQPKDKWNPAKVHYNKW